MTQTRRFSQLDVFASAPFSGNPLACVIDADGMTTEEMHRFTRWANLSESSFLLEPTVPEADYRVRIFTIPRELPFAGHPTIGSCQAWLDAGGQSKTPGRVVQECGAGLIELKLTPGEKPEVADQIAFAAPPLLRSGEVDESFIVEMAAALGIERSAVVAAQWGDNGPGWVILMLANAEAVLALEAPGRAGLCRARSRRRDLGRRRCCCFHRWHRRDLSLSRFEFQGWPGSQPFRS